MVHRELQSLMNFLGGRMRRESLGLYCRHRLRLRLLRSWVIESSDVGRVGKDSLGFEIASSKKHATEDQAWKAQSVTAEAKAQEGSSRKSQNVPYKDKYCIGATMDTSSLGSSLYYGGPDVCADFSSQYPPKKEDDDDQENANMASRGNWWQGSLYY
ncbi:hypothetical protein DsansV1_C17g0148331 [Dioscorea sansibarensis]